MTDKKKGISRRNFISGAISGVVSFGMLGMTEKSKTSINSKALDFNSEDKIIYRTLGKTGIKVPIVSLGVMNTGNPVLVKRAFEAGIRHFDTAVTYGMGRSEEMLGRVMKELDARNDFIIATKIPHITPSVLYQMEAEQVEGYFLKIFNQCLKRLQTNYIDLICLHDAHDAQYLQNEGFRRAFEKLKNQKKARSIGFSTHTNMVECLNEAARNGFYDVVLTAFNYSMHENRELIQSMEKAAAKGIGLIAMKTQCKQPWYRDDEAADKQWLYDGKIMHTALLKWVLRHDFITTAIPGVQNFQELEEDLSVAYDLKYTTEERKFLQDRNVKLGMASVCQQCYACTPTCPKGVDIPTLIRTHMYAKCYTNFYQARETLGEIPKYRGLDQCALCDSCQAICQNKIDIAQRIDELKVIYT